MSGAYVHTIWCDDIRMEVGNKPSFMGVYTGALVVQELPAQLQKLSLWTLISVPMEEPLLPLSMRLVRNENEIIVEMPEAVSTDVELPPLVDGRTRRMMSFALNLAPFVIAQDTKYLRVVVRAAGVDFDGPKLWIETDQSSVVAPASEVRV